MRCEWIQLDPNGCKGCPRVYRAYMVEFFKLVLLQTMKLVTVSKALGGTTFAPVQFSMPANGPHGAHGLNSREGGAEILKFKL